ncbi:glycine cleavage system aminomethyltransferase GcvT [Gloeobacter violaceus]|nr:glycine cleavage system aminomethyltransferase GcvT [Gloeobacter violaceus]BAC91471.1 glycine cleavage system protein T [Gloeobacter violaceus PCC 7421]
MVARSLGLMSDLKRTPLCAQHLQLGARLVPFGGWEMPLQYSTLTREHRAVRTAVGLFDISHMGKYTLSGPDVLAQIQRLVPSDLARLQPGQAQYTVLLNEQAGIIDDLIFYCRSPEHWVVIVNGATNDKDRRWLAEHLQGVHFDDLTGTHTLLALQGPAAVETLQPLVDIDLARLGRFEHAQVSLAGKPAFLARTGYTGEDGFEIMSLEPEGIALWQSLTAAGVPPCGLGARDTLRLEAAMHLYGQDMDESTTPLEASLGWVIDWDKPDYFGREILLAQKAQGTERRLVGLTVEGRQIARHGYGLFDGEQQVGVVTSGTLTPTVDRPIALAYVGKPFAPIGSRLEVDIRGRRAMATVVKRPFYRRAL